MDVSDGVKLLLFWTVWSVRGVATYYDEHCRMNEHSGLCCRERKQSHVELQEMCLFVCASSLHGASGGSAGWRDAEAASTCVFLAFQQKQVVREHCTIGQAECVCQQQHSK